MTEPAEQPQAPVRYCHGCEQYDNHPRVIAVVKIDDAAQDRLYHHDCLPEGFDASFATSTAGIQAGIAATADGKRGDDVRQAVLAANETETGE